MACQSSFILFIYTSLFLLKFSQIALSEEPNFMEQVMPEICKASQNFTERIWHLACIENLMGYYLENAADDCFKSAPNITGWEDVVDLICKNNEVRGSSIVKNCFSRHVSESLMFDARDVDKIAKDCKSKAPPPYVHAD